MQRTVYGKTYRRSGTYGRNNTLREDDKSLSGGEDVLEVHGPLTQTAALSLAGNILRDSTISRDHSFRGTSPEHRAAAYAKSGLKTSLAEAKQSHEILSFETERQRNERASNSHTLSGSSSDQEKNPRRITDTRARYKRSNRYHGKKIRIAENDSDSDRSFHESSSYGSLSAHELLDRIKDLEHENSRLKNGDQPKTVPPPVPHYTWRTLHVIDRHTYLEPPQWKEGEAGPVLQPHSPLQNVDYYLEQHPEIAFHFYKDYDSKPPADLAQILSKDGVFRAAEPFVESLSLVSEHIKSAMEILAEHIPEFFDLFPDFHPQKEIKAPYLFAYHSIQYLQEVQSYLTPLQNEMIIQLTDSILASYGNEYVEANRLAEKGMVTKRLMKYLIRPGDVLVKNSLSAPQTQAYMATKWAVESFERPDIIENESDQIRIQKGPNRKLSAMLPEKKRYLWHVEAWSWVFDGWFKKNHTIITIELKVSGEDIAIEINDLNYFPLKHASGELQETLKRRGGTFWKCRNKNFVSYQEDDHGLLSNITERYMIDIETFKNTHPDNSLAINASPVNADIDAKRMANDEPPEGGQVYLFQHMIVGYELRRKRWVDLYVDHISEVVWNKKAFESLVIDEKSKELVQALITNQLTVEKSTDLIGGKGNGLTILLHGGPGTGKTFTAEGVAEITEKPLLRVYCGDVGTHPEEVEDHLESVFELGKVWDCVVLLDEADVFLEERRLADLQRNALVSVFLRVLEYNVGILVLTSNRVGTFDEAFKSRIQLALHYKNLTKSQQKKIWRNFLGRLKTLDQDNVDFEDIIDHIDELGQEDMNGRQIRNVITTARQLAQYRGKKFCYEHLRHAIDVSGEFEQYLKTLHDGYTDDQIKKGEGLR